MKTNVKLSVIVSVYNMANNLDKSLKSLQDQTFKDFEVICINDFSSDSSLEKIQEWVDKDSRIKIINLKKNKGPSFAKNKGLEEAKGEWVIFLNTDDFFFPYAFDKFSQISLNHQDIDVIATNGIVQVHDERVYKYTFFPISFPSFKTNSLKSYKFGFENFSLLSVTNVGLLCIRKEFLDKFSLRFRDSSSIFEDIEFSWFLASFRPNYYFLQEILYCCNILPSENTFSFKNLLPRTENSVDLQFFDSAKKSIDHLRRFPDFNSIEMLAIEKTTKYMKENLKEGLFRSDMRNSKSSQKWLKLYLKELHSFLEELDIPYAYKKTIFVGEFSIVLPLFTQKWEDKFFEEWLNKNLKLLPFQKYRFLRTVFKGSKVGCHARIVQMRIKEIIRNILSLGKNILLSFGMAFHFVFTRRFRENLKKYYSQKN